MLWTVSVQLFAYGSLILSCSSFSLVLERILWKKSITSVLVHVGKSIQGAKIYAAESIYFTSDS